MTAINNLIEYFRGSKAELKKVIWATRKDTTRYTILVVIVSLSIAVILGILDFVFNTLLKIFVL